MSSLAASFAARSGTALASSSSSSRTSRTTNRWTSAVSRPSAQQRVNVPRRRGISVDDVHATSSSSGLLRSMFKGRTVNAAASSSSIAVSASSASAPSSSSSSSSETVTEAKRALLEALDGTYRGCVATAAERAAVEEAQVMLEGFDSTGERGSGGERLDDLDLDLLAGKWRLVYTTAADVLSVLRLQRDTGLLEVGDIFQSFTADGKIENEIRLSVPFLLAPATQGTDGGVALKVDADYTRVGARTLSLVFQEAKVSEVRVSDAVETLIAPALLPRGSLNHQVLLAIRELELKFPLRGAVTSMGGGGSGNSSSTPGVADVATGGEGGDGGRRGGAAVGAYLLSYLDEDLLVGRASGSGGTFIFKRVQQ